MHKNIVLCLFLVLSINITPIYAATCGNGIVEAGEDCDTTKNEAGTGKTPDCCNSDCTFASVGQQCSVKDKCHDGQSCTGDNAYCPTDTVNVGFLCTNAVPSNPCSARSICQADGSCSPNYVTNTNTVCRAATSSQPCYDDAKCTGSSTVCPANPKRGTSYQCAAQNDAQCIKATNCDGVNAACPSSVASSSVTCYTATGACDADTKCSGTATGCSGPSYKAGTVCNAASDACDTSAVCVSGNAACPSKGYKTGTQCSAADPSTCTAASVCTSSSYSCPTAGAISGTSTQCRASAGACAPATNCDGVNKGCPAQSYATTTICKSGDDTQCRADTYCATGNPNCPSDTPADNSVECRSSAGVCAPATKCSGSSTGCPAQAYATTTVCQSQDDTQCIADTYCVDGNADCPSSTPSDDSVECRSSAGVCAPATKCSGSSTGCPAQEYDSTTTCYTGDKSNCEADTICDGANADCPATSALTDTTYVCGLSAKECVESAKCNGLSLGCPSKDNSPKSKNCGDCEYGQTKCNGEGECDPCLPTVVDDPLIIGFHHEKFWFEGIPEHSYTFFSQPGLAINAKIHNAHHKGQKLQTVMGAIGLITANNKVTFDAESGKNGKFVINGQEVTMDLKNNHADLNDCIQMSWSPKSVMFSSSEFEIVFAFMAGSAKEKLYVDYINLKVVHVSGDKSKMSGILGQTAAHKLDKKANDFEVSQITAIDSRKNTFTSEPLSCSDKKRDHHIRFGASTQHQLDEQAKYAKWNA